MNHFYFGKTLSTILWLLFIFLMPVILGLISAKIVEKKYFERILRKCGFPAISQIPSAWDFKLSKQEVRLVKIKLKDNANIYGILSKGSFVSLYDDYRDMYIKQVCIMSKDGKIKKIKNGDGIYINGSEIKTVEFKRIKEEENHVE